VLSTTSTGSSASSSNQEALSSFDGAIIAPAEVSQTRANIEPDAEEVDAAEEVPRAVISEAASADNHIEVPAIQTDAMTLHSNNSSTSVLSTASTLFAPPAQAAADHSSPPHHRRHSSRPQSPPYTAHLSHQRSRSDMQTQQDRESTARLAQAWAKAEERRRRQSNLSQNWPQDPWRGGFGPPSSSATNMPYARHSVAFGNRSGGDFVGFGGYSSALSGGIGGYTGGGMGRPRPISYSGTGVLGLGGLPIPMARSGLFGSGEGGIGMARSSGIGGGVVRDEELSREQRQQSGIETSREGRGKRVKAWFGRLKRRGVA
jgi:hypothetical protein